MKVLLTILITGLLMAGLPDQSQAARLGGARSFGVQRPIAPSQQRMAPAQSAPQSAQSAPAKTPPAPAAPGNRWLGPLAGLAAGLGLGWLLSQGGFGGLMATALMGLLAVMAVFALLRLFMRPRLESQPMQFAQMGQGPVADAPPVETSPTAPEPRVIESAPAIPDGFDSAAFLRQAKLNFIRLQEANDRGDVNTLREVTSDSMFDTLMADLQSHRPAQHTDVVNLNANLLEVATEGDKHWASVRFHGTIREDEGEAAPFEEVWHLQKPVTGASGWVLAGIQQVS